MLFRPSDPMRRSFFTIAFLLTAALAVSAGAAGRALATDGAAEAQPLRGKWYGWQLLSFDLVTTACLAGLQTGLCMMPYLGSGPGIHLAHDRTGLAGLSFGLRAGLPALGAAAGALIANCPDRQDTTADLSFCGLGEVAIGMAVGAVIAVAIDAAIAFERAAPGTAPPAGDRRPLVIEPRLSFGRGGFNLGLGARF